MAKDLPEYQRRETIKPAAAPVGMANVASASTAELVVGSIGAYASQQAAQEYAQYSGKKAGKVPGQKLLPNLTPNIKSYNEAYREESAKVLLTQGDNLLNQYQQDFNKIPNPTGPDALMFAENATRGLSDLLAYADPKDEQEIRRAYFQKFSALNLQAADRVQKADEKRLIDNYNKNTEANLNNIFNFSLQGMDQAAEDSYQAQLKNLETVRDYIGEEKYIQGLQSARMARALADKSADIEYLYRQEGELAAIEYMQDFATHKQEGLTDVERDSLLPQLYNRLVQTQKIEGLSDKIQYGNAQIEMAQSPMGMLSPERLQYYQENLSKETFNDLQLKQITAQKKNIEAGEIATYLNNNAGNSIALGQLSKEQLDTGFKEVVKFEESRTGKPVDLADEARLAANYDVAIPSVNKKIVDGINSKNPEIAAQSAGIYSALALDHPNAIAGVDNTTALKADKISSLIANQTPADKAVAYANDNIGNKTSTQVKELRERFKEEVKIRRLNAPSLQKILTGSITGFDPGIEWSPGLVNDFINLTEMNYLEGADWDLATKNAADQIKRTYKETDINGFKQVMYLPPTMNANPKDVKEMILERTQQVCEASFKNFNYNPDSTALFYYELDLPKVYVSEKYDPLNPLAPDLQAQPRAEKNEILTIDKIKPDQAIKMKRIGLDGKEAKGILYISSDKYTSFPPTGELPSYSIMFKEDGKQVPELVYDADNNFTNARFSVSQPQLSDVKKQQAQRREIAIEQAMQFNELKEKIANKRVDLFKEGENPYFE